VAGVNRYQQQEIIMSKEIENFKEPASNTASLIQAIERAAMNPEVDIEKMERLLQMQITIMDRQAAQEFNQSMNKVQAQMVRVAADANNSQTRSKYASYAALDRAMRPIYGEHGFSLIFATEEAQQPEFVRVTCEVGHVSGCVKVYHIDVPADGKGAKGGDVMTKTHAVGAATSYGARYLLKLIFNIAIGEDDIDGNTIEVKTLISAEDKSRLETKIAAVKADLPRFLKAYKIKSLDELPASKLADAVRKLNQKVTV
jgi:hypothetical protein